MREKTTERTEASRVCWENLESMARLQIQRFVQELLEEELTNVLGRQKSERLSTVDGVRAYRNGHGKPRRLSMACGTITLRRPRVRGLALESRLASRLLPAFKRRTEAIGDLLPKLYLHGLAQGDFELALRGLLGEGAPLSSTSIERLRTRWVSEYDEWRTRSLEGTEVVYLWADGIYVKAGVDDGKAALLVMIAGLKDGQKIVLSVEAGQRESKETWTRILRDLRARGLNAPRLVVADGHLGIWSALGEIFPEVEEQRCWNHKLVNVLDQLPRRLQPEARELLRRIPYAETVAEAEKLRDRFAGRYGKAHPKAAETLKRDWERMVTFYRFPKDHWKHLRTTNPVESPFAAVRLRTTAARRYKRVDSACALIWKVLMVAESNFRGLNNPALLQEVSEGTKYADGIRINPSNREAAA